ncbi:MAG: lysophospholipid acyltransferase family protein [Gemmatimonadota bacterium]
MRCSVEVERARLGNGPVAVRYLAEYVGARALEGVLSALPEEAAHAIGSTLGRLAYAPLRFRRHVVEAQIAAAFPERSPGWVRETARACYVHFGRETSAIARLGRFDPVRLRSCTAGGSEAMATYRSCVPSGRGAIIVTGHIGNWELAGAFLASAGVPLAAVVKRQRNRRFDRHLAALRAGAGVPQLYMEDVARGVPRALSEGRSIALVADQDARSRGVFVTFLGRDASTFRGPARLALAHRVPLLFGALVREADGYRAVVEPVEIPPDGPGAVRELTARWVGCLERQVRRRPEQYFWFHRRWKSAAGSGRCRNTRSTNGDGSPGCPVQRRGRPSSREDGIA